MANNSNNVNRYVSEISVYYLYLILKVLTKFIYNKYEIEINNEEVDLLEKELKSDFLHSINSINIISHNLKDISLIKIEGECNLVERFQFVCKRIISNNEPIRNIDELVSNDLSSLLRKYFNVNCKIECQESLSILKKYILNVSKSMKTGEEISILNTSKSTSTQNFDSEMPLVTLNGESTNCRYTDFSYIYTLYEQEKNRLNQEICNANNFMGKEIASIVKTIFNGSDSETMKCRGMGIVSVANMFINYYLIGINIKIIEKKLREIDNINGIEDLNELIKLQYDFVSKNDVVKMMR